MELKPRECGSEKHMYSDKKLYLVTVRVRRSEVVPSLYLFPREPTLLEL